MAELNDSAERHVSPGNPRLLLLALVLLVGIPALVFFFLAPQHNEQAADVQTYATGAQEIRTFRLPDGSEIRLQENSTVAVRYGQDQRRIQLTGGAVTVIVAPDPRAFWAQAGTLRLRADTSAFSLRLNHESVVIQVLEGEVRAQAAGDVQTLRAGERVVLSVNR